MKKVTISLKDGLLWLGTCGLSEIDMSINAHTSPGNQLDRVTNYWGIREQDRRV